VENTRNVHQLERRQLRPATISQTTLLRDTNCFIEGADHPPKEASPSLKSLKLGVESTTLYQRDTSSKANEFLMVQASFRTDSLDETITSKFPGRICCLQISLRSCLSPNNLNQKKKQLRSCKQTILTVYVLDNFHRRTPLREFSHPSTDGGLWGNHQMRSIDISLLSQETNQRNSL
jgi:hypothetical protein